METSYDIQSDGMYACMIQKINVSAELDRTEIKELGRKTQYLRYVNFPVEITVSIELLYDYQI